MTVKFDSYELPITYSMIEVAESIPSDDRDYHIFQKYICYWTAFNNIYTTIAHTGGRSVTIKTRNGEVETKANGNVLIPRVNPISERDQIDLAVAEFDDDLKHQLITHTSIEFFAKRIPSWKGEQIKTDALRQRLNGVINVNHTINRDYPVWSPIDTKLYTQYMANPGDSKVKSFLAGQIVDLLYTVRNNLVHGGKRYDDANDKAVLENALPLLAMIVSAFTYRPKGNKKK